MGIAIFAEAFHGCPFRLARAKDSPLVWQLYLFAKNERNKSRVFPAICFSELISDQITVEISFAHCALGSIFVFGKKKKPDNVKGYGYPMTLPGHLVLFHQCVTLSRKGPLLGASVYDRLEAVVLHCNSEFQIEGVDMPASGAFHFHCSATVGDLVKESHMAFFAFLDDLNADDSRRARRWCSFTSADTLIHRHIF